MRAKLFPATFWFWFSSALVLAAGAPISGRAAEMKFEATLVWGTDETQPPAGKDYKPVSPEIRKKLKELPLKWTSWFEVSQRTFKTPVEAHREVMMSDKCQLNVKSAGSNGELEVVLIGKGKEVVRRKQSLPIGELLAVGGNSPNNTAWLVILKRIE